MSEPHTPISALGALAKALDEEAALRLWDASVEATGVAYDALASRSGA